MNENEFVEKMVELMDTEAELTMDTELAEVEEWDSLSYVAFLAMARANSDRKVKPIDVRNAKTVRDLYNIMVGEQ